MLVRFHAADQVDWRLVFSLMVIYAPVRQWTRLPRFERGRREFESLQGCQKEKNMKPITFENQFNHEKLICDNIRNVQMIDGIEYLTVRRQDQTRTFLIRKDSLKKILNKN